jgi:murein DD-endopeptidase MepM/ murein hydrolase activator NlpD
VKKLLIALISLAVFGILGIFLFLWLRHTNGSPRDDQVMEWIRNSSSHPDWAVEAGTRCGDAPLILPTSGFIGYLWGDTFDPSHLHQGIDIFGGGSPGVTPIIAAADGYVTRQADWKSTLAQRIPNDPLQPGRQIWLYYTHMASPNGQTLIAAGFPPGTTEVLVKAGTLLGYQGNYSGTAGQPVGVHLHFSIVQDDGSGKILNELKIENTLDPSPYLGLGLNAQSNPKQVIVCP